MQRNYTPYEGGGTFLHGATERTPGVLDVSQVPSGILAHGPGYIDPDIGYAMIFPGMTIVQILFVDIVPVFFGG